MKYIKLFEKHADYTAYKNGANFVTPNLSLCIKENEVHSTPYDPSNGHEYVDLGLPSGTLWATCNIGAQLASDGGLYFQWGDTVGTEASNVGEGTGKKFFSEQDYKFYDHNDTANSYYTKYNITDEKTILDLEDDAAYVNMGGSWHIPTAEQAEELFNESYVSVENHDTYLTITSLTNGNTLTMPVVVGVQNGETGVVNGAWTCEKAMSIAINPQTTSHAILISVEGWTSQTGRCVGFPVRGVLDGTPNT